MNPESKALFVKTIDQHQGIINSLCSVYFDAPEDVKDARQDVIVQLWKAWPGFKGKSAVSTWIYRISINTLLNKKRQESRRPVHSSLRSITDTLPQTTAGNDDDVQMLRQLLSYLGDMDKAIMVLHLEGYQNKEIAQMLDLSATNVNTKMQRIKAKMKSLHKTSHYVDR